MPENQTLPLNPRTNQRFKKCKTKKNVQTIVLSTFEDIRNCCNMYKRVLVFKLVTIAK